MNAAIEAAQWSYPQAMPAAPLRVLLAEEDEGHRQELAVALRRDGCVVIEVEDGLEVEDYLEEAFSRGSPWSRYSASPTKLIFRAGSITR